MPIYMDRHDISGVVTAENVAHLHQEDLKVQDQFQCKGLTYWFDEKRKNAFCLIEAPNAKAIYEMHKHAHGDVPHKVIEVEPGVVESFLGRIVDPENEQNTPLNIINDPALRIIMVILWERLPFVQNRSDRFRSLFHQCNNAIIDLLSVYKGNAVKQNEDHFLISFQSVSNAIHASFDIHEAFKEFKNEADNKTISLKIGLSAGLPVTEKKLIFEDTIKLAERMCMIDKEEIIVSSEVRELYKSENLQSLRERELHSLSQADEKFLSQLVECIEEVWRDPDLNLNDICKTLGCSKSQLYRKTILLTGKAPNVFIRDYKLHEAFLLLNKNSGNVSEIAYETGFSSPSYFSKCFLKRYDHLPSDYSSIK